MEAVGKVAKHLLVKYPAELTWYNVACHVLDQKTLKLKQVRPNDMETNNQHIIARLGAVTSGCSNEIHYLSHVYTKMCRVRDPADKHVHVLCREAV